MCAHPCIIRSMPVQLKTNDKESTPMLSKCTAMYLKSTPMHAKRTAMREKNTPVYCFGTPMPFEDKSRGRHARLIEEHARVHHMHDHATCKFMHGHMHLYCMAVPFKSNLRHARPCNTSAWPCILLARLCC